MLQKFRFVDCSAPSTSKQPATTNWELRVICQQETAESLITPVNSKRQDFGRGYETRADNLVKFSELGMLPRT